MGDVTSGMASTVIQVYLKSVLDSFVHPSLQTRHSTLKVIQLILAQGLVHPVQIVPYLICMATDMEQRISHTADRELQVMLQLYILIIKRLKFNISNSGIQIFPCIFIGH